MVITMAVRTVNYQVGNNYFLKIYTFWNEVPCCLGGLLLLFQRLQYHTFSWYMELLNAVMNQLCMLVIDHVSATN